MICAAIVSGPAVSNWLTIRSVPFPDVKVPLPLIVAPLGPTVGETRMPPLAIVFAPASVTVKPPAEAPARLNRKLLVVLPAEGALF